MTPLHEDLHKKLDRFYEYVPNIILFSFLNDTTEVQLVIILYIILLLQVSQHFVATYLYIYYCFY